jgi:ABC-type proline/glycine betaine transport system permease subunit
MDPRSQLSGPSVGLLITGIIGGIFELTSFIGGFFGTSFVARMEDEIPEQLEAIFEGSFWTASALVGVLIAVFLIYASIKMKELNQWGICMAASILAMIPCISPCCIVGLPIGIWCLTVLTKPDVKAAFH